MLFVETEADGDLRNIRNSSSFWDFSTRSNGGGSCENSATDPDNNVSTIPCGRSL